MDSRKIRNTLIITSEIAASVAILILVVRMIGGQDGLHTVKMRVAKGVEGVAMSNAKAWADVAAGAASVYDHSRLVTL